MAVIPTGRVLLNAKALLTKAGLSLGMTYADFGAGALGHFVLPATEMVGREGTVYAVDILKSVLQAIGSRARMEGANNLKTVWGNIEKMRGVKISDHSVDLLSCVNIVNLLDKSAGVISEISRVLKPGGLLLLVDWQRAGASFGPPLERRSHPEAVKAKLQQAGFVPLDFFEAGPNHWGMLLKK